VFRNYVFITFLLSHVTFNGNNKKYNWRNPKTDKGIFPLLPHYFKITGLVTTLLVLITILLVNNISAPFKRMTLINQIHYDSNLVGLSLVSFSKDKHEDKRIANLRLRSLSFSIGLLILLFVFQPLLELVVQFFFTGNDHEDGVYGGFYMFLIALFSTRNIYFCKFKAYL